MEVIGTRILFIISSSLNGAAGAEQWMVNVVKQLSKSHKISLIDSSIGENAQDLRGSIRDSAMIHSARFKKENPMSGAKLIARLMDDTDLVYWVYNAPQIFMMKYLSLLSKTRIVAGLHFNLSRDTVYEIKNQYQDRIYENMFGPRAIRLGRYFDAFHVLNSEDLKIGKRWKVKSIYKIPYGIDIGSYRQSEKCSKFRILYMGRLEYQKGVDLLPSIISALESRSVDYEFHICGDGTLRENVIGIKNRNIVYHGFVGGREKAELLSSAHVLIAPSRYEGFMLSGLESLASGTPVISFDIPGPKEYIVDGHNGFLVNSLSQFVDRLLQLYTTHLSESYIDMSLHCIEKAKEFDWRSIMPLINNMFDSVVYR